MFWKAKSVYKCSGGLKVNKPKSVGRSITFPWSPVCVRILTKEE